MRDTWHSDIAGALSRVDRLWDQTVLS